MKTRKFKDFNFADGYIEGLTYKDADVTLELKDWQGKSYTLYFKGVLGFNTVYLVGQDISHGLEYGEHPIIDEMRRIGEEPSRDFMLYILVGAMNDSPILSIVAKRFYYTSG